MNIRELHNKAMELAALADLQKEQNNKYNAVAFFEEAYAWEYEAAMDAYNSNAGEPSVSILLRSAASLAISCEKLREAQNLIALALRGQPPLEIADELRSLLEKVNFYRHLEVKGIELPYKEEQITSLKTGKTLAKPLRRENYKNNIYEY